MKRVECLNCTNKIEREGDAFCTTCEPDHGFNDDDDIGRIEDYSFIEDLKKNGY